MSLFARLLLGFLLAIVATVGAQAIFFAADPEGRLAPRLLLARGRLVREQGEHALRTWEQQGKSAGIDRLTALDETGLDAWIVTADDAIGRRTIDSEILTAARLRLEGRSDNRTLGIWTQPLGHGRALLVIGVPRAPRGTQALRIGLLVLIPTLVCFALSRWLYAPIERLHRASAQLGQGDLSARVGPIGGFREAQALADTFDAMANRMQGMLGTQRRMLADVSHEIRSPLARIRLAVEMARRGEVEKNLDRIARDVARLDELVEALSALVRTDQETILREPVELKSLIESIVDGLRTEDALRISAGLDAVTLIGDPRLLHSAIENVIQNALLYSPPLSRVEVRLTADPTTFEVRDHGLGVSEADLPRIFEPFFRVSLARERHTGGVGLGLAIVARAAQLHGGYVTAANHPEGGLIVRATFAGTPSLPIVPPF